jgi:hypothetical protein
MAVPAGLPPSSVQLAVLKLLSLLELLRVAHGHRHNEHISFFCRHTALPVFYTVLLIDSYIPQSANLVPHRIHACLSCV